MATSGTTSFNLNIDEVIDEGYERCGLSTTSGYEMRSARRSLDLLFAEWGNRGIHLWKTELNEIALVAGQAEYTVDSDVMMCLRLMYHQLQQHQMMQIHKMFQLQK